MDIKWIIKEYYELNTHKFDKLHKMDQSWKTQIAILPEEEVDSLSSPVFIEEIKIN